MSATKASHETTVPCRRYPYAALATAIKILGRVNRRSTVYLAPVADLDLDHENAKRAILYVADDAIVADAVTPIRAEMRACQCLARGARVIERSQTLPQKGGNAFGFTLIKLGELLGRGGR